ncbi:DUF5908 family protein [Dinghuibacter silviterrae]|uniref:Uncharacterized protein n=1 Tax=Dinghuibacter silviterrae TaxID=1539049 RepID=A0A4R8DVP8_9BACT|nr:DUF5908 family protein [Dinghuibacter silviterrae]TDX01281.1 hypothetical protein EDB95_2314 [Dinghuibacter silviterrae]
MALEIRELVVKVTVQEETKASLLEDPKVLEDLRRTLLRECVAEVMRQLEKMNER